jgi:hypothetical protein
MFIKPFGEFINEDKLYIYHTTFKVYDLMDKGIYTNAKIRYWMKKYDFDIFAHCVFVSYSNPPIDKSIKLPISDIKIKNKVFFDSDVKKHNGYLIEDSKIESDGVDVFLYIFKKNSNMNTRARQIHGFIYEGDVRRENGLKRLGKIEKWDAEGGLSKNYLRWRSNQGKMVELFDGGYYHDLVNVDINGDKNIKWDNVTNNGDKINFTDYQYWSIKCMKNKTDVELGDFKRISGIDYKDGKVSKISNDVDSFIFSVGFHDGNNRSNIIEEYIILIPISVWRTYLPDISSNVNLLEEMFNNLSKHRLKGSRTDDSEKAWKDYVDKYKKLLNGVIKLRFKRDSKGQLRIQSAISYNDFKNIILKNKHIRISSL